MHETRADGRAHGRSPRWWLALLVVAATLAAACGGDDDDGTAATDEDGEITDAEDGVAAEGEPQAGGTLVHLASAYYESMDPVTETSVNTHDAVGPAYSRLLAFAVGEDLPYGSQEIVGDLAEDWEVSDDGLTYTFTLRDDVVFHDIAPVSGRALVAGDVVSTLERIRDGGIAAYMLEAVDRIEAPDDATVVLHLSEPFAPLLNYLAGHYAWILPEEANTGGYDPATTVIGTGPFIMEDREPNVSYTYRANPDYYGEGPYIDGFERLIVPDQGGRTAAFRTGEADYIAGLSPEEAEQVRATTPDAQELVLPGPTHHVVAVNHDVAPLDDERVRRAISMAVDREGMGGAVWGGGQRSGPVVGSLGRWALPQDELAELYPYDPDQARALLAEAGAEGLTLGLMVSTGYGEQVVRGAQWLVEDLAAVGITVELELLEYATYISRLTSRQFDIFFGPQTPYIEADEWLRAQLYTEASRNRFNLSDPELDAMLTEQLTIIDEDERVEAVHDIQRYVGEHALGYLPVWNYPAQVMVSGRVADYFPDSRYGYYEYRLLWLDEGE